MSDASVCAAIITYHPDVDGLRKSLNSLSDQVGHTVIVDNATRDEQFERFAAELPPGVTLLRNQTNQGLGAAINQAATWARHAEMGYLLPLDQDSIAQPGMVEALRAALEGLRRHGEVGAVGPCFIDSRTGHAAPFVRIGFPLNRKIWCKSDEIVECDFLISSGSLIPLHVLSHTGGMDESLFIDNVDLEWCFRARNKGLRLYGIGAARMHHAIGDRIEVLPLGLGEFMVHSPVRLYYMMRNRVLLYWRRETPSRWVAQDLPRLVLKLLRFALFVSPRSTNLRYMLVGLRDGLLRRSGPFMH